MFSRVAKGSMVCSQLCLSKPGCLSFNFKNRQEIDSEGLFDAKAVHANWQKFLSGETNNQHEIWNLLMFQMWRSNLGI